jgi:hypothetical protein
MERFFHIDLQPEFMQYRSNGSVPFVGDNNVVPKRADRATQLAQIRPIDLTLDTTTEGNNQKDEALHRKRSSCALRGKLLQFYEGAYTIRFYSDVPRSYGVQSA